MNSPEIEEIRKRIQDTGLRATPARVATLQLLKQTAAPLTHAEVVAKLEERAIDKATLFRNLNDLATAGLARRTELGDHVWRFEYKSDQAHDNSAHPHFLCVECGSVSCLDEVKLTAHSVRASQEVGEVTEILLRGHCNDCSS